MGGCRCCFRECPVATERNKGMHFFKFPIKDKERLERWCKLAGVMSNSDLYNKVICARHFPDNNFMNYKNNRLTLFATPTLHRLSEELALDFSNDADNPVFTTIPPIKSAHLIPPEGFPNTMRFIAEDREWADKAIKSLVEKTNLQLTKRSHSFEQKIQACKKPKLIKNDIMAVDVSNKHSPLENKSVLSGIETIDIEDKAELLTAQTVKQESTENIAQNNDYIQQNLNETLLIKSIHERSKSPLCATKNKGNSKSFRNMDDILEKSIDLTPSFEDEIKQDKAKNETKPNRSNCYPMNVKVCKNTKIQKNMGEVENFVMLSNKNADDVILNNITWNENKMSNTNDLHTEEELMNKTNEEPLRNKYQLNENSKQLEKLINELLESEETVSDLNAKIDELVHTNDELKTQLDVSVKKQTELDVELAKLKLKYEKLKQDNNYLQEKYIDLKSQHISLQKESQTQQKQTKIQLFNGIKKYLSQTMIALLRIQLTSGNAEREWRPDERNLAKDLMSLGEKVYKYFTDEWLIRLPPMREVNSWRVEDGNIEEDDDF